MEAAGVGTLNYTPDGVSGLEYVTEKIGTLLQRARLFGNDHIIPEQYFLHASELVERVDMTTRACQFTTFGDVSVARMDGYVLSGPAKGVLSKHKPIVALIITRTRETLGQPEGKFCDIVAQLVQELER